MVQFFGLLVIFSAYPEKKLFTYKLHRVLSHYKSLQYHLT